MEVEDKVLQKREKLKKNLIKLCLAIDCVLIYYLELHYVWGAFHARQQIQQNPALSYFLHGASLEKRMSFMSLRLSFLLAYIIYIQGKGLRHLV